MTEDEAIQSFEKELRALCEQGDFGSVDTATVLIARAVAELSADLGPEVGADAFKEIVKLLILEVPEDYERRHESTRH
jgi:hypothetical protein